MGIEILSLRLSLCPSKSTFQLLDYVVYHFESKKKKKNIYIYIEHDKKGKKIPTIFTPHNKMLFNLAIFFLERIIHSFNHK